MWLSRSFKNSEQAAAETGVITISAKSCTESASSVALRSPLCYAPYGYAFRLPVGEEVLIVNGAPGAAVAGSKMKAVDLEQGEIELSSLGGARIRLKNDGCVEINGLVIDKNGEVKGERINE